MKSFLFFIILALVSCSGKQESQTFARLKQLEGRWQAKDGTDTIYENWQLLSPQEMFGKSYFLTGKDTVWLEHTKLVENKRGIFYIPSVARQNRGRPVFFRLISSERQQFVFENKDHDFPQRIIYHLSSKDSVHAWIEGTRRGKPQRSDYYFVRK
jgi:hypothetical protein